MRVYKRTGNLLREVRKQTGLSQNEFAKKYDVHPQYVSNYERGLCAPKKKVVKKLIKQKKMFAETYRLAAANDFREYLLSEF